MDASEIHARKLNAKEVSTPMKNENFVFPVADGTVKTPGGDRSQRPSNFSHDNPRTPNVNISGRRFKYHQNSTRRPQEREERKKIVAREGKTNAKFGAPTLRGPTIRAPHFF